MRLLKEYTIFLHICHVWTENLFDWFYISSSDWLVQQRIYINKFDAVTNTWVKNGNLKLPGGL